MTATQNGPKDLLSLPLHPFLVAAYPVLALYAHNLDELSPAYAAHPLALALIAAGLRSGSPGPSCATSIGRRCWPLLR